VLPRRPRREAPLGEGPFWWAGCGDRGGCAPLYGVADGGGEGVAGGPLLGEAHDLLGGVDVHVHPAGVDVYLEGCGRVAAARDGRPVGVVEAAVEVLRPDKPAVYGDRLVGAAPLGEAREGCVAGDPERSRLVLHFSHRAGLGHTVDLGEPLQKIPGRRQG
jgi:hypothetical protein